MGTPCGAFQEHEVPPAWGGSGRIIERLSP
jgi:hypothetical protein